MRRRIITAREMTALAHAAMADYDDYAGHHQSPGPGTGFPIHNMHSDDYDLGGVPEDWQTHPQYYAHSGEAPGVRGMKQTQQMYNRVNGRPDEMVDIYRALPHGNTTFNKGDWVTPSLAYARGHAMSEGGPEGDLPVIKSTVPAQHLWQNGDSYYEMGYHGPSHQGTVVGQGKTAAWQLAPHQAADIDQEHPELHKLVDLPDDQGRFSYPHESREDRGNYVNHEWGVHPTDAPATHTQELYGEKRRTHYNPALTEVHDGEFRPETTNHGNRLDDFEPESTPGTVWRGMSHEEMQAAKANGHFESHGDYNFAGQEGKTLFDEKPASAANYANSFAPTQYKPTFTRPAHVIGIPDKGYPRNSVGEVEIPGKIPLSAVTHHYQGDVVSMSPGRYRGAQDTPNPEQGYNGFNNQPSRSQSPSATVQWSPGELHKAGQRQAAVDGLTFRHSPGDSRYCPKVEAFKPGIPFSVGSIAWQPHDGEVEYIETHRDHQRQGIGTALFNHAQSIDPRVHHSDTMSADGAAFAQSMGHDTSGSSKKMAAKEKSYLKGGKCKYCKADATKSILHSEGMAYVQTCDKHLQKGKDAASACVPFGDPDPSNIDKVYDLATKKVEAAVNQGLVDRLKGEFHDWHKQQPKPSMFGGGMVGGLDHWPQIENFLKDRYPAAHRGLGMGHEMAGPLLDGRPMNSDSMMPGPLEYSYPQSYSTGNDAIAEHGYDPAEVAAGMLMLHNKTDRFRGDMSAQDQARLNDIAQKRTKMQRDYEQRTSSWYHEDDFRYPERLEGTRPIVRHPDGHTEELVDWARKGRRITTARDQVIMLAAADSSLLGLAGDAIGAASTTGQEPDEFTGTGPAAPSQPKTAWYH